MDISKEILDVLDKASDRLKNPVKYAKLMTEIATECLTRVYTSNCFEEMTKAKSMMTYEQFRDSGRNVRFEDCFELRGCDIQWEFGRIYANSMYIGLMDDAVWHLIIGNAEYTDTKLENLEHRLYYDWYVHEQ